MPALFVVRELKIKLVVVEPDTLPPLVRVVPLNFHRKLKGAVPAALTLNRAVPPLVTVNPWGPEIIPGGHATARVATLLVTLPQPLVIMTW